MIKKLLIVAGVLSFVFLPFLVGAAGLDQAGASLDNAAQKMGYETGASMSLEIIIGKSIQAFLGILGIVFLVIIIFAGVTWMVAGGDPKKVQTAKDWMTNGVIGLVIILSAYAISSFVVSTLITNLGTVK